MILKAFKIQTRPESRTTSCSTVGRAVVGDAYRGVRQFSVSFPLGGIAQSFVGAAVNGLAVIACKDYKPRSVMDSKTSFPAATGEERIGRLAQLLASPDLYRTLKRAAPCHGFRSNWEVITGQWQTIFTPLVHAQRKDSRS
jgi:hypothetical protein